MRILVLGAGMLSYYLRNAAISNNQEHDLHFASRSTKDWENLHLLDIRDTHGLDQLLRELNPDVVINTAVYGNVAKCEKGPEGAEEINHLAQRNVISSCNKHDIKLIYISTNSVFCGRTGNYGEEDTPHPATVYGMTKLRGEEATKGEANNWAIFRITALFGDFPGHPDFIQKIISELRAGNTFQCWDQVITPSYGPYIADAILRLIEEDVHGIWHIAGTEQLSRYDIGMSVQEKMGSGRIVKVRTPEGLPLNRTLCVDKLRNRFPDLVSPEFRSTLPTLIESGLGIH